MAAKKAAPVKKAPAKTAKTTKASTKKTTTAKSTEKKVCRIEYCTWSSVLKPPCRRPPLRPLQRRRRRRRPPSPPPPSLPLPSLSLLPSQERRRCVPSCYVCVSCLTWVSGGCMMDCSLGFTVFVYIIGSYLFYSRSVLRLCTIISTVLCVYISVRIHGLRIEMQPHRV